jgi:hypothetical protein
LQRVAKWSPSIIIGRNVERLAQEFRAWLATRLEAMWNERLVVLRFRLYV